MLRLIVSKSKLTAL
jgi:hypothetical protein